MRILIDVWSDFVCPFCYLHAPVLEQIAAEFGPRVNFRWRAFELRPDPVPTLDPRGEYLQDIWKNAVYPLAWQREMTLHLPPVQPRSRLAHEATQFAATKGRQHPMAMALFKAFFEDGRDIGDAAVLAEIAGTIGLDSARVSDALASGLHRPQVLAEEQLAAEMEVTGVPAMYLRREGDPSLEALFISGAQPRHVVQSTVQHLLTPPRSSA